MVRGQQRSSIGPNLCSSQVLAINQDAADHDDGPRVAYLASGLFLGLPTSACRARPVHKSTKRFRYQRWEQGRLCPQDLPKHLRPKSRRLIIESIYSGKTGECSIIQTIDSWWMCILQGQNPVCIVYGWLQLAGPDSKDIDNIIKDMKISKLDITIKGDLQYFLEVNIKRKLDVSIHLIQPHHIDHNIHDLRL